MEISGAIAKRLGKSKGVAAPTPSLGVNGRNPMAPASPLLQSGPYQGLTAAQGKKNPLDPRGLAGIISRGPNVYNGGSSAAHRGGGFQYGRPTVGQDALSNAIARRVGKV